MCGHAVRVGAMAVEGAESLEDLGQELSDESIGDLEEAELQEMLRQRVNAAIALAASGLAKLESFEEVDLEQMATIQRAHVKNELEKHDDSGQLLRLEVEDSLSGLQ